MNPYLHDLSTWRATPPPAELRARVLRRVRPAIIPRLSLVVTGVAGLLIALVIATAPVRAEALLRTARVRSQARFVHAREARYADDGTTIVGTRELWLTPKTIRSLRYGSQAPTSNSDGDRDSHLSLEEDVIQLAVGGESSKQSPAVTLVQKAVKEGEVEHSNGRSNQGEGPVGSFSIRRWKGGFRVESISPLSGDFDRAFDPEWLTPLLGGREEINVREVEGNPTDRVILVSGSTPLRYRIFIDRESGLMRHASEEVNRGDRWTVAATNIFDYPATFHPRLFDPGTLNLGP